MKTCIVTTPIRPHATYFPPLGSMAIIQALKKIGINSKFYNIDYLRPKTESIKNYFIENNFEIIGISAVVSTAYSYTKWLSRLIRETLPNSIIICGGNLCASAEVLLRKTEVNVCVVGDGEKIIQELALTFKQYGFDSDRLRLIRGICFIDQFGKFVFTGYGLKPSADEIEFPDYSILEEDDSIDHYIPIAGEDRMTSIPGVKVDLGRAAVVTMAKGCIARCTFCHRWEKGYRAIPVSPLVNFLMELKSRYGIKYVDIADENFGSNKPQAHQIASELKKLNLKWVAGGVRSSTVSFDELMHWKDCGCINVTFGVESGSQTILDVMEKKTTVEQNLDALKWTYQVGMKTVLQLVLGMPGESDKTVLETINFLKEAVKYLYLGYEYPSAMISLNYAQALPGTPLYEYAREKGFIGHDLDSEEAYLIKISDTDAYKEDHFVNYTGYPLLKVFCWQQEILANVDSFYIKEVLKQDFSLIKVIIFYMDLILRKLLIKIKLNSIFNKNINQFFRFQSYQASYKEEAGYYNIRRVSKLTPLLLNPITKELFPLLLPMSIAFGKNRNNSAIFGLKIYVEYLIWHCKKLIFKEQNINLPKKSLRKIVNIREVTADGNDDLMYELRKGR